MQQTHVATSTTGASEKSVVSGVTPSSVQTVRVVPKPLPLPGSVVPPGGSGPSAVPGGGLPGPSAVPSGGPTVPIIGGVPQGYYVSWFGTVPTLHAVTSTATTTTSSSTITTGPSTSGYAPMQLSGMLGIVELEDVLFSVVGFDSLFDSLLTSSLSYFFTACFHSTYFLSQSYFFSVSSASSDWGFSGPSWLDLSRSLLSVGHPVDVSTAMQSERSRGPSCVQSLSPPYRGSSLSWPSDSATEDYSATLTASGRPALGSLREPPSTGSGQLLIWSLRHWLFYQPFIFYDHALNTVCSVDSLVIADLTHSNFAHLWTPTISAYNLLCLHLKDVIIIHESPNDCDNKPNYTERSSVGNPPCTLSNFTSDETIVNDSSMTPFV
jgi:hypothetical protein